MDSEQGSDFAAPVMHPCSFVTRYTGGLLSASASASVSFSNAAGIFMSEIRIQGISGEKGFSRRAGPPLQQPVLLD